MRVIAPDVGGAFGGKARTLPRGPRGLLRRTTSSQAGEVGRDPEGEPPHHEAREGAGPVRRAGDVHATGGSAGSRSGSSSTAAPTEGRAELATITLKMVPGVYDIPNYEASADVVMTNKVPLGPYRGAGRPEASYLIERAINIASAKLKLDPVKVRQLNYIKKEQLPVPDLGRAHLRLRRLPRQPPKGAQALRLRRAPRRAEAREAGGKARRASGSRPGSRSAPSGRIWPQTASMSVSEEGRVQVSLGGHSTGRGTRRPSPRSWPTSSGVADGRRHSPRRGHLGPPVEQPHRGEQVGRPLRQRRPALREEDPREDVRHRRPKSSARGRQRRWSSARAPIYREDQPSKKLKFSEVAALAYDPFALPPGMEPTLFAYSAYAPKSNTYPFGNHVALVEVDRESGVVKLLKYFAVDDGGKILNPLVVEGQVHGGVVQGIGQALTRGRRQRRERPASLDHPRRLPHPLGGHAPEHRVGHDRDAHRLQPSRA